MMPLRDCKQAPNSAFNATRRNLPYVGRRFGDPVCCVRGQLEEKTAHDDATLHTSARAHKVPSFAKMLRRPIHQRQ